MPRVSPKVKHFSIEGKWFEWDFHQGSYTAGGTPNPEHITEEWLDDFCPGWREIGSKSTLGNFIAENRKKFGNDHPDYQRSPWGSDQYAKTGVAATMVHSEYRSSDHPVFFKQKEHTMQISITLRPNPPEAADQCKPNTTPDRPWTTAEVLHAYAEILEYISEQEVFLIEDTSTKMH